MVVVETQGVDVEPDVVFGRVRANAGQLNADAARVVVLGYSAKARVELHVIEGVTHIFDRHGDLADASARRLDLFLDRHVVNPRTYPSTEPGP
jgi:hypothetical protein